MIEIILQGGLGNQMFEYATAYALARQNQCDLVLDMSFYDVFNDREWCRPYELNVFALQENAKISSRYHLWARLMSRIGQYCLQRGKNVLGRCVFELDDIGELKNYKALLMCGYFGSYRLFSTYREELLQKFTFVDVPNEVNAKLLFTIQKCESVAVHIRRGDYIDTKNNDVFYHLSPEWYRQAMKIIDSRVKYPCYYFFSDDIAWAREQFSNVYNAIFVDVNHGREAYNDMRLMSACKHNIIANSTFSWWGAWLNTNPYKIVVAPYQRFQMGDAVNERYRQRMIPSDWITL